MKSYTQFITEVQKGTLNLDDFVDSYKRQIKKAEEGSMHGDFEWHVVVHKTSGKITAIDDLPDHDSYLLLGTAVKGEYNEVMSAENAFKYFEEGYDNYAISVMNEALSFAGRRALKRAAKKRKARLTTSRRIAKRKTATFGKIKNRASRRARRSMEKQITGGKIRKNLSHAGLNRLQQMVNARSGMLDQLRRKLVPQVRADERNRKSRRKG